MSSCLEQVLKHVVLRARFLGRLSLLLLLRMLTWRLRVRHHHLLHHGHHGLHLLKHRHLLLLIMLRVRVRHHIGHHLLHLHQLLLLHRLHLIVFCWLIKVIRHLKVSCGYIILGYMRGLLGRHCLRGGVIHCQFLLLILHPLFLLLLKNEI